MATRASKILTTPNIAIKVWPSAGSFGIATTIAAQCEQSERPGATGGLENGH